MRDLFESYLTVLKWTFYAAVTVKTFAWWYGALDVAVSVLTSVFGVLS